MQRQAYHGGSFVGSHIHIVPREQVLEALVSAPLHVSEKRTTDGTIVGEPSKGLLEQARQLAVRYRGLLRTYADARKLFLSAQKLSDAEMTVLEEEIKSFLAKVRSEVIVRQNKTITPKLHLLEDHVVTCMRHFGGVGHGLLGEGGGGGGGEGSTTASTS